MCSVSGEQDGCLERGAEYEESNEQIFVEESKEKRRADTPDSGGGYFTLSESDTGSTLGKESPHSYRAVITAHHSDNSKDICKNGKIKIDQTNKPESKDNVRHAKNNPKQSRTILPPRPPRTSTELPPTVPKRIPTYGHHKRDGVYHHRDVVIPSQKPLKKMPPLQIQSPSLMKSFQKASSTEDISNQSKSCSD